MANSHSPFSVVIVTDYTTVYPTYSVVVVTEYTTVYSTESPINSPTPTDTPHTTPISTTTSSQITSDSSSTSTLPPVSSTPPETTPTGEPRFDDTFAYVVLALMVLLVILLLTMLISMIYLRWRGKCPDCQSMRKQLEKWESGEQKRITPAVVRRREALNKSASQAELDLERGDTSEAAGSSNLKAVKRLSTWKAIKRKPVPKTGASAPVAKNAGHSDIDGSFRVQSNPPQVHYEPSIVYSPSMYKSPDDWPKYPSSKAQQTDGYESRVFADVSVSPPKHYAAYVTDDDDNDGLHYPDLREQEIREAEAAIQSEEYKKAETIMKRASAPDSVIRRATSIVNFADQRLNIARNPSMYPEFYMPSEAEYSKSEPGDELYRDP